MERSRIRVSVPTYDQTRMIYSNLKDRTMVPRGCVTVFTGDVLFTP